MIVSTLGVIALVAWVVGGLPLGVVCAMVEGDEGDAPEDRGLTVLGVWGFAPLIGALALVAGLCWVLGRVVGRVERAHPTRETLEARIRELEDETGVGP